MGVVYGGDKPLNPIIHGAKEFGQDVATRQASRAAVRSVARVSRASRIAGRVARVAEIPGIAMPVIAAPALYSALKHQKVRSRAESAASKYAKVTKGGVR